MKEIEIHYLSVDTYTEICASIGFIIGGIAGLIGKISTMSLPHTPVLEFTNYYLLDKILNALVGAFGITIIGVLIGLTTYIPYRLLMKFRKGMTIKYN